MSIPTEDVKEKKMSSKLEAENNNILSPYAVDLMIQGRVMIHIREICEFYTSKGQCYDTHIYFFIHNHAIAAALH